MNIGDIVTVTNQEDEGWWHGELNGTIGWLVMCFVLSVVHRAPWQMMVIAALANEPHLMTLSVKFGSPLLDSRVASLHTF